ncbi:hypothetical protein [Segnochrobactrum spirostomi]|uniref:hypothetical protein n=1 Tax=Segnochrobactrum spirostomi TaxID=2608987 RepID=UPI0012972645|nr:hypothetical protein [Segnochrobactrum spirostomi]
MVKTSLRNALKLAAGAAMVSAALFTASCTPDEGGGTVTKLVSAGPKRHMQPVDPELVSRMATLDMDKNAPIMIRLFKEESKLEVWKQTRTGQYALLVTYDVCKWSGLLGPKVKQGDRQAPEGFYDITPGLMNPNSRYYLAFNTGFPNAYDRSLGRYGTDLMVHGSCSSRGCYAMTDQAIGQIFALARDAFAGGQRAFQFQAYPFRMTAENMAIHYKDPNMPFWRMLKVGYDSFEITRVPPKVDVCGQKYVFNSVAANGEPLVATRECPALTVSPSVASALAAKERRDDAKTAQLVAQLKAKDSSFFNSLMVASATTPKKVTGGADGSLVRVAVVSKPKRTTMFGGTAGLDPYQKAALTAAARAGDPVAIAALGSPVAPPVLAPGAVAPAATVSTTGAPAATQTATTTIPGAAAPVSQALTPLHTPATPAVAAPVAVASAATADDGTILPPAKPTDPAPATTVATEQKTGWFASLFGGAKPAPATPVATEVATAPAAVRTISTTPAAQAVTAQPASAAEAQPTAAAEPAPQQKTGWFASLFGGSKQPAKPSGLVPNAAQPAAATAVASSGAAAVATQPVAATVTNSQTAGQAQAVQASVTNQGQAAPTDLQAAAGTPAKSGNWFTSLFGGNKQAQAAPAAAAVVPSEVSATAIKAPPLPLPAPVEVAAKPAKRKVIPAEPAPAATTTTTPAATPASTTTPATPTGQQASAQTAVTVGTATVASNASSQTSARNDSSSFSQAFGMFN